MLLPIVGKKIHYGIIVKLTLILTEDKSVVIDRIKRVLSTKSNISVTPYNNIIVARINMWDISPVAVNIVTNREGYTEVTISILKIERTRTEGKGGIVPILFLSQLIPLLFAMFRAFPDKNTIAIKENPISSTIYAELETLGVVTCRHCGAKSIRVVESESKSPMLDSAAGKLEAVADVIFLGGHMAGGLWEKSKRHTYRTRTYKCNVCGEILKSNTYQVD